MKAQVENQSPSSNENQSPSSNENQSSSSNETIVKQSSSFIIPYQQADEQSYVNLLQSQQFQNKTQEKIRKYLVSMRLLQKATCLTSENQKIFKKKSLRLIGVRKGDLVRYHFAKKINLQITEETIKFILFSLKQWNIYKNRKSESYFIKPKEDQTYLTDLFQEIISQKGQSKPIEKNKMIEEGTKNRMEYKSQLRKYLEDLINHRSYVNMNDRNSLITIVYLLTSLMILDNYQEWTIRSEQIQGYFRQVQTQKCETLLQKVMEKNKDGQFKDLFIFQEIAEE